jgi:hypothetical protein
MVVSSREKQTPIRIPNDIKEWIKMQAAENGRSMNTEVVFILKNAMKERKCEKQ